MGRRRRRPLVGQALIEPACSSLLPRPARPFVSALCSNSSAQLPTWHAGTCGSSGCHGRCAAASSATTQRSGWSSRWVNNCCWGETAQNVVRGSLPLNSIQRLQQQVVGGCWRRCCVLTCDPHHRPGSPAVAHHQSNMLAHLPACSSCRTGWTCPHSMLSCRTRCAQVGREPAGTSWRQGVPCLHSPGTSNALC